MGDLSPSTATLFEAATHRAAQGHGDNKKAHVNGKVKPGDGQRAREEGYAEKFRNEGMAKGAAWPTCLDCPAKARGP